jgi:hypothetical protein
MTAVVLESYKFIMGKELKGIMAAALYAVETAESRGRDRLFRPALSNADDDECYDCANDQ